jgi:hypothetical protein
MPKLNTMSMELESNKGTKILSLQGVQCNGVNNEDIQTIDCNY